MLLFLACLVLVVVNLASFGFCGFSDFGFDEGCGVWGCIRQNSAEIWRSGV